MMAESFSVTELVNDLTVVPLTGYEAYDTILAEVADAQAFAEYGMHDLYDRENTNDFSNELLNESYQTVGWTLRDLDGNGTPELLMGGDWSDGYTPIFNIYKLEDGKAERLLYGWNRNQYWLCANGAIGNCGSNGAGDSNYSYYRYEDGELKRLETVQYYGYEGMRGSSWNYSATSDHFHSQRSAFHHISEQEADRIIGQYEDCVTLDYKPFTTGET